MKRHFVIAGLTMSIGLGWSTQSEAIPIAYTTSATASGSLGGTAFLNALVTVTLSGDTANVALYDDAALPGVVFNVGTATLDIAGVGAATFNSPKGYASFKAPANSFPPEFGVLLPAFFIAQFDDDGQGFTHILGLQDDALAGYDLRSAFGPLTSAGGVGVAVGESFATTSGNLVFASGAQSVTFMATVPEPASALLLGVGVLPLLETLRRRKHS